MFLEASTEVTIEADDLEEAGDSVVAAVIQSGAGQESGANTEFGYFHVWSFRGGKVIRLENFREGSVARQAAGLLQ